MEALKEFGVYGEVQLIISGGIRSGPDVANYLQALVMETQAIARACGKSKVHNLKREHLVALTLEASAMARVPLAGTDFIMG